MKTLAVVLLSLLISFLIIGFIKFDWAVNNWEIGARIVMMFIALVLFMIYQMSNNFKDFQ